MQYAFLINLKANRSSKNERYDVVVDERKIQHTIRILVMLPNSRCAFLFHLKANRSSTNDAMCNHAGIGGMHFLITLKANRTSDG